MVVELDAEVGAENVVTDDAGLAARQQRFLKRPGRVHVLATQIIEHQLGADSISGDQRSFDDLVRVLLNQLAVFERTGFRFICVDQHVFVAFALGDNPPLDAVRETRAATTAQIRRFQDIDNFIRRHGQGFLQPFVAAMLAVDIELVQIRNVAVT